MQVLSCEICEIFKDTFFTFAIFRNLSKVFDTLNHRLLLTKFKAYGLQLTALKQTESFRTGHHHRTTVNNAYSSWSEIIPGVPQGSALGPHPFNIFLNNLLFFPEETFLSNCADTNTLYEIGNTVDKVKKKHSAMIFESLNIGFTKT